MGLTGMREAVIVALACFLILIMAGCFNHSVFAEMTERRFPPPWSVEELDAAFVVTDSTGQKLAYDYFEDEPGRQAAAKLLSKERRGGLPSTSLSCRRLFVRKALRNRQPRLQDTLTSGAPASALYQWALVAAKKSRA